MRADARDKQVPMSRLGERPKNLRMASGTIYYQFEVNCTSGEAHEDGNVRLSRALSVTDYRRYDYRTRVTHSAVEERA